MARRDEDPILMDQLYAILSLAAEEQRPCPPLASLAMMLGIGTKRLHELEQALVDEGRIQKLGGPNQTRQIKIMATGKVTLPVSPNWARRIKQHTPKGENLPPEIEDAKLWLMRQRYVVYRAWVRGGPRDQWIVGGRIGWMSDRELLNFARARGWQQSERRAA